MQPVRLRREPPRAYTHTHTHTHRDTDTDTKEKKRAGARVSRQREGRRAWRRGAVILQARPRGGFGGRGSARQGGEATCVLVEGAVVSGEREHRWQRNRWQRAPPDGVETASLQAVQSAERTARCHTVAQPGANRSACERVLLLAAQWPVLPRRSWRATRLRTTRSPAMPFCATWPSSGSWPREGGGGGVGAAASSRWQILASQSKMAARVPGRRRRRRRSGGGGKGGRGGRHRRWRRHRGGGGRGAGGIGASVQVMSRGSLDERWLIFGCVASRAVLAVLATGRQTKIGITFVAVDALGKGRETFSLPRPAVDTAVSQTAYWVTGSQPAAGRGRLGGREERRDDREVELHHDRVSRLYEGQRARARRGGCGEAEAG